MNNFPPPAILGGSNYPFKFTRKPVSEGDIPWEDLGPMEWCGDPLPEPYSNIGWAFACCPSGHPGTLTYKHQLDANGSALTPSYVCPIIGCGFHEFVLLGRLVK